MKGIVIIFLLFVVSSCVTTPEEKSCIKEIFGEYESCKKYAYQETLKEYGITGIDCLDYSAQVAKEWEGTYMIEARKWMKTAAARQVKNAYRECYQKVKEKKSDCESKVDACLIEMSPISE